MNHFWQGFEKRAEEEKTALPWLAGLAHVAQNKLMNTLVRKDFFGKNLGRHFTEGLLNKKPSAIRNFLGAAASGATVPEVNLLQSHVRDLGNHLREGLLQKGITHLDSKDLESIQHAIKGDMLSARRSSPRIWQATESILKESPLHQQVQHKIRQLAQDPNHPLASNIAAKLVQAPENLKGMAPISGARVNPGHGASLAGGLAGSAALSVADPFTGALNASKFMAGNETGRHLVSKLPMGERALRAADRVAVRNPVQKAFQEGVAKKKRSWLADAFQRYGLNAVTAEASHTANHVGNEARRVFDQKLHALNQAPSVTKAFGLKPPFRKVGT